METQTQTQIQEKTAPFISILLSAAVSCFIIIHFSCSQEMILWLFALRVSHTDYFFPQNLMIFLRGLQNKENVGSVIYCDLHRIKQRRNTFTLQAWHMYNFEVSTKMTRTDLMPAIHAANTISSRKGYIYQPDSQVKLRQDKTSGTKLVQRMCKHKASHTGMHAPEVRQG